MDLEGPICQRYNVHPSPVTNILICKIMNGWTRSGLVSQNLAAAFTVAATICEAMTNRDGQCRLMKDMASEPLAMVRKVLA